ncbi:MAG: hypothetical protein NTZ05_23235 [Chloroflexi bacterium]|nr:hypothetical protein [Chloroflexota bacterium]
MNIQRPLQSSAANILIHCLELFTERVRSPQWPSFSILWLLQGIELLLRNRLAESHAALIFQDIDRPTAIADTETVIHRLQTLTQYPLAAHHLVRLRRLQALSGRILYRNVQLTDEQALLVIADTLPFLDQLLDGGSEILIRNMFATGAGVQTLAQMADTARMARRRADLAVTPLLRTARGPGQWPLACPRCLEEYLVADSSEEAECRYCQHHCRLVECPTCGRVLPEEELGLATGRCPACDAAP